MLTAANSVRVVSLAKSYPSAAGPIPVFQDLSFDVQPGERLAITGESGSGKSTLLHLLGGLDRPTIGQIYFNSIDIITLDNREVAEFRNHYLGFVWQMPSLLPEFTALENVMMPLLVRGENPAAAEAKAKAKLNEVGLQSRMTHQPGELSGGEQQRVSLARALVGDPKVLMADEPTGSLDFKTGGMIFDLLSDLHRVYRFTCIFVTHNLSFAQTCDRILELEKGQSRDTPQVPSSVYQRMAGVERDATRLDGGTYV